MGTFRKCIENGEDKCLKCGEQLPKLAPFRAQVIELCEKEKKKGSAHSYWFVCNQCGTCMEHYCDAKGWHSLEVLEAWHWYLLENRYPTLHRTLRDEMKKVQVQKEQNNASLQ